MDTGQHIGMVADVFELEPSDHMTANEIAASNLADQGELFNPQQQFVVTWPEADPTIAMAYVDQLARSAVLSEADAGSISKSLTDAQTSIAAGERNRQLRRALRRFASNLDGSDADAISAGRMEALETTLVAIAKRL